MIGIAGNFLPGFLFSWDFFVWTAQVLITGSNTAAGQLSPTLAYWNHAGAYTYFPSGVLWTLSVELAFYALVPLIFARALARRRLLGISMSVAAIVSLYRFWNRDPAYGPGEIDDYLWIFLAGAALNIYWDKVKPLLSGTAPLLLAVYVLLNVFHRTYSYQDTNLYAVMMTLLLVATTISCAHTGVQISTILKRDISYGIYLWHMPIIWTMGVFGWVGGWMFGLIALVATLATAYIVRVNIEEPALRLRGTWRRQLTSSA